MKKVMDYFSNVSLGIWAFLVFFIPLIINIIVSSSPLSIDIQRLVFFVMLYCWGFMYFPLIFKRKLKIGPWIINGKIVPILGLLYLLVVLSFFTISLAMYYI